MSVASRRRVARFAAAAVVLAIVFALIVSVSAQATEVHVDVQGGNGVVRTIEPGLSCADGDGSYRHYLAEAGLAGGALSQLRGKLRATLDLHYDDGPREEGAFLLGTESHVTMSNHRGTVQIALRGGDCESLPVDFDGTTASWDDGTWIASDLAGTGSYREISGSGTFGFTAEMNPGADNTWTLRVDGDLTVLQPHVHAQVERTFWGNLGLDYLEGIVTVVYRVANTGPGDAFDVTLASAARSGGVAQVCGEGATVRNRCPSPQASKLFGKRLGDLAGGCVLDAQGRIPETCDSEMVAVRYRVTGLRSRGDAQICVPTGEARADDLTLLSCRFGTRLDLSMGDALDVALSQARIVPATTPALPPPL